MKQLLITGATGLLGRAVMKEMGRMDGVNVRGTGFSRTGDHVDRLDLCDASATEAYIKAQRPDVIIHSAAERRPDVSQKDPDATLRLNVAATGMLAECARSVGAWVIYLSTDYVFDGTHPPYAPTDPPHPPNLYGQSKWEGERAMQSVLEDVCVLRVPILYGPVEFLAESAITIIADDLIKHQGREMVLDAYSIRYPTHVNDVAVVLRQIVEYKAQHEAFSGIHHWSGDEAMTKYDMGVIMSELMGMSTDTLVANPNPGDGAPRPKDCHLDCTSLEQLGIGRRTAFRPAIAEVLNARGPQAN